MSGEKPPRARRARAVRVKMRVVKFLRTAQMTIYCKNYMEIVILKQKNYTALKYLTLLLFITSTGALRCAGMAEKNNNFRARHYLPKTEDVDKLRALPVVNRGARPKKICNTSCHPARCASSSRASSQKSPRAQVRPYQWHVFCGS